LSKTEVAFLTLPGISMTWPKDPLSEYADTGAQPSSPRKYALGNIMIQNLGLDMRLGEKS